MSGRWSAAIFTTCPNLPRALPPTPTHRPTTNMWEQRFWGWGRSRATLLGLRGGFKLIWGRLPFIFPTELSFSSDQEPLSLVLTAGIEGSNQNARDLRLWNAPHTQLCRCACIERNVTTSVELHVPWLWRLNSAAKYMWSNLSCLWYLDISTKLLKHNTVFSN